MPTGAPSQRHSAQQLTRVGVGGLRTVGHGAPGRGDPQQRAPGLQVPAGLCSQVRGCEMTCFPFSRAASQGRGGGGRAQRRRSRGEPACVFVFKLFLSPRPSERHMPPPTSPESSHDTGPPSCDETDLPNFSPCPHRRLSDPQIKVFVSWRTPSPRPQITDVVRGAGETPGAQVTLRT